MWIPITVAPLPFMQGILVTDGEKIICCEVQNLGGGVFWLAGHNFDGHEWDWEFDKNRITHWMPLPELPNNVC